MDGLVEKVADAVCGARCDPERPDPGKGLDEFIARAAIEAVFDALAEQGEAAASEIEYPGSKRTAADYWPIMLATLRKQALG